LKNFENVNFTVLCLHFGMERKVKPPAWVINVTKTDLRNFFGLSVLDNSERSMCRRIMQFDIPTIWLMAEMCKDWRLYNIKDIQLINKCQIVEKRAGWKSAHVARRTFYNDCKLLVELLYYSEEFLSEQDAATVARLSL
jgi:hypothetical protein